MSIAIEDRYDAEDPTTTPERDSRGSEGVEPRHGIAGALRRWTSHRRPALVGPVDAGGQGSP